MTVHMSPDMALRRNKLQRWRLSLFGLSVLIGGILVFESSRFYWHQQLYQTVKQRWSNPAAERRGLWLPGFSPDVVAKPLAGVLDDLSGITYDYDQDRLLVITNGEGAQIVALNTSGNVLARYPLAGFVDTEGLAYLGGGRVVVTEEIDQRLSFIQLPEMPQTIHREADQFISIGINNNTKNKGFEGVTYDPIGDRLFVIKERDPRQLYEIGGVVRSLKGRLSTEIIDRTSWVDDGVFARDLADVYYHPTTGHLILLSEQSKLLIELDSDGRYISYRSLLEGFKDVFTPKVHPEGVTMDAHGRLYVVAEPNLFYSFSPQPPK
ncbi:SdiA-regulated domain-containing protein [Pseudomonas turukhanskensis]|uniref:SdiA-regulated domain-containing protein n=1 Tax=Pseudomonas turukhanskensis TaxID=1806536 RepID=UPI0022F2EFB1|nr:SdiA-regulated domain-containing protein [Pseudomonas turukhanskensis]